MQKPQEKINYGIRVSQSVKPRHELKYGLNYCDYVILRDRLKLTLKSDSHADENGEYKIRSSYFDTPTDTALMEKINGVNHRSKYRIRRYVGSKGPIKLEKKSKNNNLCYKESCKLKKSETEKIIAGETEWMMDDERPLVNELYFKMTTAMLKPKTIVDYVREPYIYQTGNVRVTFDKKIHTGIYSTDFLNDDSPTVPTGDQIILMEVKYDQFFPEHIKHLLNISSRRASAFSKYAQCRIYG
jgi:hypothetical protein